MVGKIDMGRLNPEERKSLQGLFQKASVNPGERITGKSDGWQRGEGKAAEIYEMMESFIEAHPTDAVLEAFAPMLYKKDKDGRYLEKIDRKKVEQKLNKLSPQKRKTLWMELRNMMSEQEMDNRGFGADSREGGSDGYD